MKAYIATTGVLFLLLTVIHILRFFQEAGMARDPWYWLITLLAFALSVWALTLLRKAARPQPQ
jgi:hypothetical protein